MAELIRPLNVDVAAQLRMELEHVDSEVAFRITRLCEQAQSIGYHNGYVRGLVDGRHREQVDRPAAIGRAVADERDAPVHRPVADDQPPLPDNGGQSRNLGDDRDTVPFTSDDTPAGSSGPVANHHSKEVST